jgi:hypothetical protein
VLHARGFVSDSLDAGCKCSRQVSLTIDHVTSCGKGELPTLTLQSHLFCATASKLCSFHQKPLLRCVPLGQSAPPFLASLILDWSLLVSACETSTWHHFQHFHNT